MHHFDPVTTLFNFLIGKILNAVWNYGKQLMQAVALYYLFLVFVASYVSQPRPIAARGIGCPVAP